MMNAIETLTDDIVLVVEDAPQSLGMLQETLEREGYTVLLAADGEQALKVVERITPNVILMDALLPGLDGFDTTRRIRRNAGLLYVPIIFMTGLSDTEHIVSGLQAGAVDYLTKPIDPVELVARLRVHLANAREGQRSGEALEMSGRPLLSVDSEGGLRWATQHARALLLSHLQSDERSSLGRLPDELCRWCRRQSSAMSVPGGRAAAYRLEAQGSELHFRLIGPAAQDELLLSVKTVDDVDHNARLRACFNLTDRESEVLHWLIKGKSNKEIAVILAISSRTVNKHLDHVFVKLGVENRTAAAIIGLQAIVD